jgi:hypothetical protein
MKLTKNYKIIIAISILILLVVLSVGIKRTKHWNSGGQYVTEKEAQDWCEFYIERDYATSCNIYFNADTNRWCNVFPSTRDATDCSASNYASFTFMYVWPSTAPPVLETYTCSGGQLYKNSVFMGNCAQMGTNYVNVCKKSSGTYTTLDNARADLCDTSVCSNPCTSVGSKRAVTDTNKYEECVISSPTCTQWVLKSCPSSYPYFSSALKECITLTTATCEFGECSSAQLHTCDGDYRLSSCNWLGGNINKWCWSNRELCQHGCTNGVCNIVADTCQYSNWTPLQSTKPLGQQFTQTRTITSGTNCKGELSRVVTGTLQDTCIYSSWSPLPSTKLVGEEFNQTRTLTSGDLENCVEPLIREMKGTGTGKCLALLQDERDDGTCALSGLSIGVIGFLALLIVLKVMNKGGNK